MDHRLISLRLMLTCAVVLLVSACSTSGGGGGAGAGPLQSAAGPDLPCNPVTHQSGCQIAGNQIMLCDAATSKWQSGTACAAGMVCVERVQLGATIYSGTCVKLGGPVTDAGGVADAVAGADGKATSDGGVALSDTGATQDTGVKTPDTATPDTAIPDTGTPDTAIPDTAIPDTGVGDTGVGDTGVGDTGVGDTVQPGPIKEPNVAQPTVGGSVPAPVVNCPTDGTEVKTNKNGYVVVYRIKKTPAGDVLHGPYEAADSNGNILEKSCYMDGNQAGTYTSWFSDGTKRIVISYTANGLAQGPYQVWDKQGKIIAKGVLKDDKFYGRYEKWYDGGTKLERSLYFNPPGQLRGVQKFWYENGQERSRSFYDTAGNGSGTSRGWNEAGKLVFQGDYVSGMRDGLHIWWRDDGSVMGSTVFNKGTGVIMLKFANGTVAQSGKVVSEKREGVWESFTSAGVKTFQGIYQANAGPVKLWFTDGKKGIVSSHDKDLRYHGSYAEWDSGGVQTWAGKMVNGTRVGTWKYILSAGQKFDICYVKGTILTYDTCPSGLVVE